MKNSNNITKYRLHKTNIHILGTAHISQKSVDEVEESIQNIDVDCVAIELCQKRYDNMTSDSWKNLDILDVIRQKKGYVLMASLIMSWYQRRIGKMVNVKPGEEFRRAIQKSKERQIPIELVDRDMQITLKRVWQGIGFFNKMFILTELFASLFYKVDVTPESIEEMKKKDVLENFLDHIPAKLHKIKDIIIKERDIYIAEKVKQVIEKNPGYKNILLVVGAGHVNGIKDYWEKDTRTSLESICYVKSSSIFRSAIQFFVPIILIMFLIFYFSDNSNQQAIWQNIFIWIGVKSFCSGVLALIVLPHPLALLGAILTAPISNFNPFLKPGWVSSIIQAYFKKPNVSDFENIYEDMESWKTIWKNKLIRILALLLLPQLGSSIGTVVALAWIL